MRVLYLEDNSRDADLARRELVRHAPQIKLDILPTLEEALARLKGEPIYDLVLADLRLPDGSGMDLLSHIRKHGLPLAVVIMTGKGDEQAAVAALKNGADDYIVKAKDYLARLPLALENALDRFRAEAARKVQPLRVLYAEHSAADIDLTLHHMANYAPFIHIDVIHTAVEIFRRFPAADSGQKPYDVLLMDYHLPGLNALETVKRLREELLLGLPVVLVTGQGDEEVAVQAMRLGVDDYLTKSPGYLFRLPAALENSVNRARLTREQAALREKTEELDRYFNEALDLLCIADTDGYFRRLNKEWESALGYRLSDLEGRRFLDFVHPDDLKATMEALSSLKDQKAVLNFVNRYRCKDGSYKWMEWRSYPSGKLIYAVARDVTEHKRAETRLAYQASLLENVNDAVISSDKKSILTSWNKAAERIFGWKAEEALGRDGQELLRTEFGGIEPSEVSHQLNETGSYRAEILQYRKDGTPVSIETNIMALKDEHGRTTDFIGVNRDITDRKRAETALRENEKKYRNLVETISDVIFAIDARGALTYVSPVVKKVLEYEPDELIGRSFVELVHEEDRPILANRFAELRRGVIEYSDYRVIDKRGEIRWVRTLTNPIIEGERFVGARGTLVDISARKQAEEKLKETLEELQKAFGGIIDVLSAAVEKRDPYTAGHQKRVTDLALAIAQEMGLDGKRVDGLSMAGTIHDLGKISVPAEILSKPGLLTEVEFRMIQTHPKTGWDILKKIDFPWPIGEIILQHHERMNGSGYPQGLKGEDIRLEARILAVADVMEAMASHRPYRPALGIDAGLAEIEKNKGVLYDPGVGAACLKLFGEKRFTFEQERDK